MHYAKLANFVSFYILKQSHNMCLSDHQTYKLTGIHYFLFIVIYYNPRVLNLTGQRAVARIDSGFSPGDHLLTKKPED